MKAFISALLGYDKTGRDTAGGILGVVNGYYGCVEAQGRGTLHCHMLVWVEGGLNPNEIRKRISEQGDTAFKERLLAFLDDTISSYPSVHPASTRGVFMPGHPNYDEQLRRHDLNQIASACQLHSHTRTCYKLWRGPPEPRVCRFDLDPANVVPESTFDESTGELSLRCLDGMVNNFNTTILEAVRCNMDLKFIGSGDAAKAVIYYITDYITKSQLKAHVAYSALELAVNKLSEFNDTDDDMASRAKQLLQKCAFSMLHHQELSAQQVVSYLMDCEDHFTTHKYAYLYWTSFERHNSDPSANFGLDTSHEDSDDLLYVEPDAVKGAINRLPDEVGVTVNGTGRLVPRGSQVSDYVFRGAALNDVCLWDFISRTEKMSYSM
ncbi:hypothetical protein WOLCODRAFT_92327 [Wolfiporia cocos MD-104 SS10]|uniref:Helitron helicase-like domain-containing protein n=1 Tax=Wolfiporia cocos (strain MD-104) TaxID=742152 RepID=A0A2H3J582_WOLCO|nr:hypothetical protein WOLCODRAFT_92327 [Wolfiporia cocos MD-104 SS10]